MDAMLRKVMQDREREQRDAAETAADPEEELRERLQERRKLIAAAAERLAEMRAARADERRLSKRRLPVDDGDALERPEGLRAYLSLGNGGLE